MTTATGDRTPSLLPFANEPVQKYESVVARFQLPGILCCWVGAAAPFAQLKPSTESSSKWQVAHALRPLFDHEAL